MSMCAAGIFTGSGLLQLTVIILGMNLPLGLTLFIWSLSLGAIAAAVVAIRKSRSERQDDLRYGRMRPSSQERLFRAPSIMDTWGPPEPHRSEPFAGLQNASR
jgi:hypothetical protein